MSLSRWALDLPINKISSAKNSAEMLREPRSIPRPEELSSAPRLLMKSAKSKGERLQPKMENDHDKLPRP